MSINKRNRSAKRKETYMIYIIYKYKAYNELTLNCENVEKVTTFKNKRLSNIPS